MEVFLDTCGRRTVKALLLLYLFVAKAAANCPKPQARGDIVLTNDALLMNDFPEGVDVTLQCGNGYVKDSGSGVITCVDDNWTEPDLTCKKKDCGLPNVLPNMSFNTSSGTLFGAIIKVICDKGFQVSGSSYKQCYASGWVGKSTCELVTCEKPVEVPNGKSSWVSQDEPTYGEIIQYICNVGFTLIGKNSIMCSETGDYDAPLPTCEDSSTTPRALRDKTVTTKTTAAVSPSVGALEELRIALIALFKGGRDILTAGGRATTSVTSMTSSSFQDKPDGAVDPNKDTGNMPVILSVICVSLGNAQLCCPWESFTHMFQLKYKECYIYFSFFTAVCIMALFLHKFLLKRKGSYDTREDLKPELLQFQNL
ncbi:complement factor H isoform X3 [Eleginops maclovinus]|uniref:complement factor H isoform X3 n=1 Tax=Eleginops maclovinus TaxID=56733 RepID=UPI00307FD2D8